MLPFQPGVPPEQLRAILGSAVLRQVQLGWRVESQFDNQAVMRKGGDVNHLAHALAVLFTCGIWLPVWVILAVTGTEQRIMLTVDPNGVVLIDGRPAVPLPGVDPNAHAVAAVNIRRDLRQRARQQAAEDVMLARELRIGRPDLPRHYDDGGLVDLNHVPPGALLGLRGVTPQIAEHIVAVRDRVGAFTSAEELAATAGLHPDLTPEIREYGIFLP